MNLIIPDNWRKNVSVRVIAKLTWSPRAFQYRFHFYGWRSIPICKASSVKGKHISYIIRYKKSKRRWKQISSTFPSSHNASTWRCLNKNKKSGFNVHLPMQRHGATSFDSFSFDELQYRQNLFPYRLEFGVVGVVLINPFLRYYLWLTTAGVDEFDIFHYESKVEFNFQRTKRKIRLYFNLFRRNCFKLEEN